MKRQSQIIIGPRQEHFPSGDTGFGRRNDFLNHDVKRIDPESVQGLPGGRHGVEFIEQAHGLRLLDFSLDLQYKIADGADFQEIVKGKGYIEPILDLLNDFHNLDRFKTEIFDQLGIFPD
jgi:hypothetical protein